MFHIGFTVEALCVVEGVVYDHSVLDDTTQAAKVGEVIDLIHRAHLLPCGKKPITVLYIHRRCFKQSYQAVVDYILDRRAININPGFARALQQEFAKNKVVACE